MSNYDYSGSAAAAGVGAIIGLVVGLALCVVIIVAMAKLFQKAGKPGWHAIIPFLNNYDLFEIGWGNGILFLLTFIPVVNFVIMIMLYLKLSKAFGKDTGFAVGMILLPIIFLPMLGFGDAEYIGPDGVPQAPAMPYPPYGAPQQPYQAPQQPYQAPQQPYQAPQQPYQAPQQPYQQNNRPQG